MSVEQFKQKARHHWTKWQPKRVAQLRADGDLESTLRVAAVNAQERLLELMDQGFRAHEAEEVALHEFILLKPEPGLS